MNFATFALFLAGLGWGTTGLFVRTLGQFGLSVVEMLSVRLAVTGVVILPLFIWSLKTKRRAINFKTVSIVGGMMVLYYLGAITAFHHLQLVVAALLIGSSPVIAWVVPLISERRGPSNEELKQGTGVLIAVLGLFILAWSRTEVTGGLPADLNRALGYFGGLIAASVTVINARILSQMRHSAPQPLEITLATVFFGLMTTLILGIRLSKMLEITADHPWMILGFGVLSTALPGIAIAYASARLPPQATSTVSIQLQIWSAVLAWIILKETMTMSQIVAALLVIVGSAICVRQQKPLRLPD